MAAACCGRSVNGRYRSDQSAAMLASAPANRSPVHQGLAASIQDIRIASPKREIAAAIAEGSADTKEATEPPGGSDSAVVAFFPSIRSTLLAGCGAVAKPAVAL